MKQIVFNENAEILGRRIRLKQDTK